MLPREKLILAAALDASGVPSIVRFSVMNLRSAKLAVKVAAHITVVAWVGALVVARTPRGN